MNCAYCRSAQTKKLSTNTDLGYSRFCCHRCRRTCNERTGTPFHLLELPTDLVFQVVLFRFQLSLRDLTHLFLLCGCELRSETVPDWEARFAPLLAEPVRRRRKAVVGRCGYVAETYLTVRGRWVDLYRALDKAGQRIDSLLRAKQKGTVPYQGGCLTIGLPGPKLTSS